MTTKSLRPKRWYPVREEMGDSCEPTYGILSPLSQNKMASLRTELVWMPRKDLQQRAKELQIKANQKSDALVHAILEASQSPHQVPDGTQTGCGGFGCDLFR